MRARDVSRPEIADLEAAELSVVVSYRPPAPPASAPGGTTLDRS
jgi:hypothetical protein